MWFDKIFRKKLYKKNSIGKEALCRLDNNDIKEGGNNGSKNK